MFLDQSIADVGVDGADVVWSYDRKLWTGWEVKGGVILVTSNHPFAEGTDTPWTRITWSASAAQTIEGRIR
jgi:hypothetical protein